MGESRVGASRGRCPLADNEVVPRRQFRSLLARLAAEHPEVEAAEEAVLSGRVMVDGRFVTNPKAQVAQDAAVVVVAGAPLRGIEKLGWALDVFGVEVRDRIALDVGAAAGGFTTALLDRGARRVYAVDAGHGQLLGSLRQDPRVVNLEATNVGSLTTALVPEAVGLVTVDVSYLSLASAAAQLSVLAFEPEAQLVGLVKPMFELGRGSLPTAPSDLEAAVELASAGVAAAGWRVLSTARSGVTGSRGAVEFFVHAVAGGAFAERTGAP